MATSEPLVATGQPYGERQETRAMMQQAGVPLAPPAAPSQGPVPAGSGPVVPPTQPGPAGEFNPLDLLGRNGPEAFPFLAEPPANPASSEPDSTLTALAASAQSSFALAVIARLQQQRGGGGRRPA